MGILKSATSGSVRMAVDNRNFIGAESFRTNNPYGFLNCYKSDAYASIYPSVKAIAYEFKKIRPYAIDSNGKEKQNVPALNALYHPNQTDSSVSFREKLAVMALTHKKTYILVWRKEGKVAKPGGELVPENIAGFTFLEAPGITRRDNKTYYNVGSQYFTEDEVMVIPGGVDPHDLYGGYAPGEASRQWATLDDYIADYQKGFFENGAVPSGQFIITASSKTDYEDTVNAMQSKHRGAGKNNNVTYTPRPVDPQTGKPGDSKIEWIPFASSNKDIDFKNLFDQANKRIDSAFGVPASIRGVGENNNYATARLDEKNFLERAVDPLALSIYTQITHELNRITGGLGVAITYKLEIPTIADEEKVEAETKVAEVNAIITLTDKGFSLDSVVEALKLSDSYKNLKVGGVNTQIVNDKPDVDEGDEVTNSPDPDKIDGTSPLNKGAAKSTNPKAKTEADYEKGIARAARDLLNDQINNAIDEVEETVEDALGDPTRDELKRFVDKMMINIAALVTMSGEDQHEEGKELLVSAGISTEAVSDFVFSSAQQDKYRVYVNSVGKSYSDETAGIIRNLLTKAEEEGATKAEIKKSLKNLTDLEEYRVERIARTETVRAGGNGSVFSMEQIQADTGYTINKIWNTSRSNTCEYCAAMDGKKVGVSTAFVPKGGAISGEDGGVLLNDFVDMDIASAHPNCSCYLTYEVVR